MNFISRFNNLPKPARRRWQWVFLGLFALGLRFVLSYSPSFVETVFSRGVFVGVRFVLDYSFGLLPFPIVYLFLLVMIFFAIRGILKVRSEKLNWKIRILRIIHGGGAFFGGLIFFFLFLWGFNYQRIPIEEKLEFNAAPLDGVKLRRVVLRLKDELVLARSQVTSDTSVLAEGLVPADLQPEMRTHLCDFLEAHGYPTPGRVRTSNIWPPGALMRFGIAGIYLPFTGEGYLPRDMPRFDQPFTVAHEMSHAYGFGDEGTCNFLAYMACERSQNPVLVYSGRLNYWGYVINEYYRMQPDSAKALNESLPPGIKADRRVLQEYSRKYRSFLTGFGRSVNHAYLKSQGVREGIKSYNRMVILVEGYNEI